jgi:ferrous iron transport protein B
MGTSQYEEAAERYGDTDDIIAAFAEQYGVEIDEDDPEGSLDALIAAVPDSAEVTYITQDEETLATEEHPGTTKADLTAAVSEYLSTEEGYKSDPGAPDPAAYGTWVPGIPALIERGLDAVNAADWLKGLILDGVVAGVGAVLGFVPQMLVLFFLLAFLEACGYMARIAFVLDRVFRKFGLSGKSFIPMLIGVGCGVPGIMASRTIENERDRRMTIMTTTFIPCGAKVPFISMIAGAIFGGSAWVATSAYFIGMAAIVVSGIMLKKTKRFAGEPAPFVMELPAYHWPTLGNVLRSMWERGWSFIKKAGTIILLSTILVWFLSRFGVADGVFRMLEEEELDRSILAVVGNAVAWIFAPLGFGTWQATVASVTGLIAKENIVGTMGILYGGTEAYANIAASFTGIAAFSFLVFNLLCAPCFAAIGATRREMNNAGWTWFAILYQCGFAYAVSLMIYQFGGLFTGNMNVLGIIAALAVLGVMIYMLFIRKYREATHLTKKG